MLPPSFFCLLHEGWSWPADALGGCWRGGGGVVRTGDQIIQRWGERESGRQHAKEGFPTAANTSNPTEEHLQTQERNRL